MEKVERRARVHSPGVDAEPAVVVPGVQDENKTIVNLREEFVRFGGDQGVCLEAGTVGLLPRVPDAGEGKRFRFGEGDGETRLMGLATLGLYWALPVAAYRRDLRILLSPPPRARTRFQAQSSG
jgi:hypothetical protein